MDLSNNGEMIEGVLKSQGDTLIFEYLHYWAETL